MILDLDLLKRFERDHSQDAFTDLVKRHVNLVYSAALRQVRSPHLAEEITQSVFADLARNAGKLKADTVLTAWLYQVARRTAIDVVRKESRRQAREQIALEMNHMNATAGDWTQIEPLLDDAMDALDETDRAAILLRYFENKNLREVGESLKISDDAAQKRVSRALERLREFFTRRNITIGASGLAVLISANAVQSAPIGLIATLSAAAVLTGTTVSTSTVIAAAKTIAMTTLQKTLITAALVATIGAGAFEAHQASQARVQNLILQQQQAPLAEQVLQLKAANQSLSKQLAEIGETKKLTDAQFNELMKLRGEVGQSRNNTEVENDPAFQKARLWLAKESKLRQQFEQRPDQWIPEMKFLSDEEWLDLARKADLDTPNGMRCALSNTRAVATWDFGSKLSQALAAYMAANNQQPPDSTSELSAYFRPALDDADTLLARYEMLSADQRATAGYHGALLIQKVFVDHLDNPMIVGPNIVSSIPPANWAAAFPDELQSVAKAYADANSQSFMTPYDLLPYTTTPAQKAALDKVIKEATAVTTAAPSTP
jgi:RNA polymerase sigma factor (sigma-70 family)